MKASEAFTGGQKVGKTLKASEAISGGQKVLSYVGGLRRVLQECYKLEQLDNATYVGLLIHVNQLHSRTTEFVRQQENVHLKQGGSFYNKPEYISKGMIVNEFT